MHLKQKHPHLRVILSIGGGQSSQVFPTIAASAVLRDNFGRSARGLVEASGLDGIDSMHLSPLFGPRSINLLTRSPPLSAVVWQYPTDSLQGANFIALLAAVRLYLPEDHYLVTIALPAARSVLGNVDLSRAAAYLDFLNLMAYDLYGSRSGHHAQLYPSSSKEDENSSASSAVSYLMNRGFPAKKILLGIPVFGRRGSSTGGDGRIDYHQLPRKGTKEQVDKRACAAYCVGGGSGFVSYDNPDTVKMKATFVKQKGLGVSLALTQTTSYRSWSLIVQRATRHPTCMQVRYITQGLTCSVTRDFSTGPDQRMRRIASEAWSRQASKLYTAPVDSLDACYWPLIFSWSTVIGWHTRK